MAIHRYHVPLLLLDLFVALTAGYGGLQLVADPTGASLEMPLSLLRHSPFADYRVPGWILLVVVGGTAAYAAARMFGRRASWAPSAVAGATIAGWIVVELAMVRAWHPFQLVYLLIGAAQVGLAAAAAPGPRAEQHPAITQFLAAPRIAFVGLSTRPQDFSRAVADALRRHGHTVIPVHPGAAEIDGAHAYGSVRDIPVPPPAALLMVPAARAEAVVRDCVDAGVRVVWFHRGAGPGSASPEAVALAEAAGLAVVRDACPMMVLEPAGPLHGFHRWWRGLAPLRA